MINDQDYMDSIPAYVLGALEPDELSAFEARMAQDTALRNEVRSYQQVVAELPLAAAPVRPPAALKSRLMAQITAAPAPTPVKLPATPPPAARAGRAPWRSLWPRFAALAAMLLVIGLGAALIAVSSQLQTAKEANSELVAQLETSTRTLDDLRRREQELSASLDEARRREQELAAELSTSRATLARLQQEIVASEQLVSFLSTSDLATRNLQATTEAPLAQGAMFMRPGQRDAIVVVSNLPPLPQGDSYQFWLAKDGAATQFNAGILEVDATGTGRLVLQAPEEVNAFAEVMITVEHQPDATSPSSTTVLYGAL